MSATERQDLVREASRLKMRAMRLRTLGDEADKAEAIQLLHEAGRMELAVLAATPDASEDQIAGGRIEACGLFLTARDPVRAIEQWRLLPRGVFSSKDGAAMLSRLRPLYATESAAFSETWRSIKKTVDMPPSPSEVSVAQLRSMTNEYPGVAELWWALSLRANGTDEAEQAGARMRTLNPALVDARVAESAWFHVEHTLVRRLKIEMRPERRERAILLDAVGRIATAFGDLLKSFVEEFFGEEAELLPSGGTAGSFILELAAEGVPPHAIEELDKALADRASKAEHRRLAELLSLLLESGVKLAVSVVPPERGATEEPQRRLIIDAKRRKSLLDVVDAAGLKSIDSRDIPQADRIDRVFRIVDLLSQRRAVDAKTLDIDPRQVSYYVRATKILGFLTESGELTAGGRLIARLGDEDRLRATVVHFESSVCGDAWIRWSKGKTLLDVDPTTAPEFLADCVPNLGTVTAGRRAQTLNAWHKALRAYHYAAPPGNEA